MALQGKGLTAGAALLSVGVCSHFSFGFGQASTRNTFCFVQKLASN